MIRIPRMTGLATIQDLGRRGHGADAVPVSGAMDAGSLALANAVAGNPPDAAAIEWALAGGTLAFDAPAIVAVTGARAELFRNGGPLMPGEPTSFAAGDELTVGAFLSGAYLYVAIRGGIDVPLVLGSRSTYLAAGFGGLEGRRLRAGDSLRTLAEEAHGEARPRAMAAQPRTDADSMIRVLEGPGTGAFSPEFRESFWSSEFTVSRQSNRTGYRLERERGADPAQRNLPSSPACVGSIQVADGGGAIVLMADGPTVGGYPKIGVVASADVGALAQRTPGERVRFQRVSLAVAHGLLREEPSLAATRSRP